MSDERIRRQAQLLAQREAELVALQRRHERALTWWGTFHTLASGLDERSDVQTTCERWCGIVLDELEFPAAVVLRVAGDTLTCVAWPAHLGPQPPALVDADAAAALRAGGSGRVDEPAGPLVGLAAALRLHRFLWATIDDELIGFAGFDADAARFRGRFEEEDLEQFRWVVRHLETVLRNVMLVRRAAQHERVAQMLATVERQREELERRLATISEQAETIRRLSTPAVEIWDGVLALPIVGAIDPERARDVTGGLLERLVAVRARWVLLDVTGVESLDAGAAGFLVHVSRAVALLGARCLLTGVQPAVAAAVAELGGGPSGLLAFRDLRAGLRHCLAERG